MESASRNVLTMKFITSKQETVIVSQVSEESMEFVKSVQLEQILELMENVEHVESINNLLMDNVFALKASFQTNLKYAPNAVKYQAPS